MLTVKQAMDILKMEESERIKVTNGLNIEDLCVIDRVIKANEELARKNKLKELLQAASV